MSEHAGAVEGRAARSGGRGGLLLAGGCALAVVAPIVAVYVAYRSDTGFHAQADADEARTRGALDAAQGRLARIAAALPATLEGSRKAPAGTSGLNDYLLTDAAFLGAFRADGSVAPPATGGLQDQTLVELAQVLRAGKPAGGWSSEALGVMGSAALKPFVAVFIPRTFILPGRRGDQAVPGQAEGQLALYRVETGELVAHGPLQAASSSVVTPGGGGGFGLVLVPPFEGAADEVDRLNDFSFQFARAAADAVARMQAP